RRHGSARFCRRGCAVCSLFKTLASCTFIVMPAKAGVQGLRFRRLPWVPAFARTTREERCNADMVRLRRRRFRLAARTLGARFALALGDARLLAGAAAEIIELGAANGAFAHHLDRDDARRIEREDALDALAIGNLAQGEARIDAGILARDAH